MAFLRYYISGVIDHLEKSKCQQIFTLGFIIPAFFAHTIAGAYEFFTADEYSCRGNYQDEVCYIIILSLAFMHCLILLLVIIGTVVHLCKQRRRQLLDNQSIISDESINPILQDEIPGGLSESLIQKIETINVSDRI